MASLLYADIKTDEKIQRLEESILKLQKILKQNQEADDDIEAVITKLERNSLKMNGYINSYYVAYNGTANASEVDGFRLKYISFIPHQQVNDKLRWLSEIEFEDMPRLESNETDNGSLTNNSTGQIFVERAYIQYDISSKLKFRIGRDFLYSTIYSDNHYPSFVLNQFRPYLERKVFNPIVDGLQFMGNFNLNHVGMDYVLYYGNGNVYKAGKDINSQDLVGTRVRFSLPYFKLSRLSFAFADGYTSDTAIPSDYKKHAMAVGLEEKIGNASLTLQYAKAKMAKEKRITREGYYLRLAYTFNRITPWIYYETYDATDEGALLVQKRGSVGIEYALSKEYKLRLEHYISYDVSDEETVLTFALNF